MTDMRAGLLLSSHVLSLRAREEKGVDDPARRGDPAYSAVVAGAAAGAAAAFFLGAALALGSFSNIY